MVRWAQTHTHTHCSIRPRLSFTEEMVSSSTACWDTDMDRRVLVSVHRSECTSGEYWCDNSRSITQGVLVMILLLTVTAPQCAAIFPTNSGRPANFFTLFNTVRVILTGTEQSRVTLITPFDPEAGPRWRGRYNALYGYRGRDLIAALGRGYTKRQLISFGAVTPL
uniref:Uncharacterized protein n=1 Tax=Timema poppense TaxID=170557 RepID=A0A7R9CKJ7_TIMPO|nr:unnamed protein product [Timema poppensis]